jgi:hypothetical protein
MTEEIIGSKMKSENAYGQNGYQGPSSDNPGEKTATGFVPQSSVPNDGWQTRPVSAEQKVPTTFGTKNPNANPAKVPGSAE